MNAPVAKRGHHRRVILQSCTLSRCEELRKSAGVFFSCKPTLRQSMPCCVREISVLPMNGAIPVKKSFDVCAFFALAWHQIVVMLRILAFCSDAAVRAQR